MHVLAHCSAVTMLQQKGAIVPIRSAPTDSVFAADVRPSMLAVVVWPSRWSTDG